MRSLTGAILFGASGDGVLARFRVETTIPMMKIKTIKSNKNSTFYPDDIRGNKKYGSDIAYVEFRDS